MPAPQAAMLSNLAKLAFKAKDIKLPTNWEEQGDQYPDAFEPGERSVPPSPPMNLFREETLNKYHVDTAKTIGEDYAAYIDGICDAICNAISLWMVQAQFKDIKIFAVSAIGTPGCVTGPELEAVIFGAGPKSGQKETDYTTAVSKAFSKQWKEWQDKIMCPGLPMYPAFAAFPAPQAPPMPNVPFPLIAFPSSKMSALMQADLKDAMVKELEDIVGGELTEENAIHAAELFDAIAQAFSVVFPIFLSSTMVTLVMGQGPIPTFAPPYVPVGPVVNGSVLPTGSHFV